MGDKQESVPLFPVTSPTHADLSFSEDGSSLNHIFTPFHRFSDNFVIKDCVGFKGSFVFIFNLQYHVNSKLFFPFSLSLQAELMTSMAWRSLLLHTSSLG